MLGIAKDRNRAEEMSFYWQHFGLNYDPFSAHSEPAMFVSLPKFDHHMDLLLYLIRNENALLAVLGEKGSGKSFFLSQFITQIDDEMHVQHIAADSLIIPHKLLSIICKGFKIDYQIGPNQEENLDNIIAKIQHKDKTCLLTIDDAHFLPLETLQMLLYLIREQSSSQMRLHVILAGDHNLQSKLSNLVKHDLSGNMIHAIELERLSLEETKQYLHHRLHQTSSIKPLPLSDQEIERIHLMSHGIPEQINVQAQQVLLNELSKRKPTASSSKPSLWRRYQTQLLGGALFAAFLIIAALLMNNIHIPHVLTPTAKQQEHEPTISFNDMLDNSTNNMQLKTAELLPSQNPSIKNQALTTELDNDMPSNSVNNFILDLISPDSEKAMHITKTESPATISTPTQSATKESTHLQQAEFIAIDKNNSTISLKINDDASSSVIPMQNQNSSPSETSHQPIDSAKENNSAAKPVEAVNAKFSTHPSKAIQGYTIQIIGLSEESAIQNFMTQNHLQTQAHYFQTKLGDKPFFLLVYGTYASEQEAQEARRNLPTALKEHHPWVRALNEMNTRMKMLG